MGRLLSKLVALGLVAGCGDWVGGGGGSGGGDGVDARGPDYTYRMTELDLPTSEDEALALALDVDGRPNDGVDNRLGSVLAGLVDPRATAPEDIVNSAISRGQIAALVNVRANDLVNASGVGLYLFDGDETGPSTFEATPFDDNVAVGRIVGARYTGQAERLTVRLGAIDGVPITLPLHEAKVQLTALSLEAWDRGTIAGAIAAGDRAQLAASLAVLTGADAITAENIVNGEPLDVDLDGDGTNDALSVGLGVRGALAWFTPVR